jgi:uncharacterized protein YacL
MYETFFVIGLIVSAIIALLVSIPLTVGTVQFWVQFVELIRKRKKHESGDKIHPTP